MTLYKRKLLNLMLFGYGGLMLLLVCMLTGAMLLDSNVLYQNSLLLEVTDILITVVDVFAYAISAVTLIYGIYLIGSKSLKTVYAAYLCITVFHYIAILCIGWLVFPNNRPETIQDLFRVMLEDVVLFIALDCLRMLIIGFVTNKVIGKHENARAEYNRKAKILGTEIQDARSIAFPFTKFVSFKNPVQAGVITTSIVYWLTFYFQYVYVDILVLLKFEYVEGFAMQIIYLLLNAVLACICYCIVVFMLMKLDEKMPKS